MPVYRIMYSTDYIKNKLEKELEPIHLNLTIRKAFVIGLALIIRLCTSYYPYSGANKPPIYGDYEAQRHWQEITLNLPISQWYSNSTDNDLQYWGLDYPPLTAYHSLMVAHIAHRMHEPKSVKLHESRGYESHKHKYFMRLSVLVVDLFTFIPAVLHFSKNNLRSIIALLCYPGIILIDYGHFQYNCVSLGLFVASVSFIIHRDSLMLGSCFFVLALNYKQMELYHALPFFFYILGLLLFSRNKQKSSSKLFSLTGVALTVLATFAIIWAPFLVLKDLDTVQDVILRLFPFKRGIFEDKVANIWCAINVLYKLKSKISNSHLAVVCLSTTLMALVPSSVDLLFKPSKAKFLLALVNSSLAFFLCSFQVHEKSILLVAVPVLLYMYHHHRHHHDRPSSRQLLDNTDPQLEHDSFYCFWFLLISVFSMLPLLIKDNLFVAYIALSTFFFILVKSTHSNNNNNTSTIDNKSFILFRLSLAGVLLLSVSSILIEPPKKYPDLHSLLTSLYSCCHFVAFLIYFNCKQILWTKIKYL